jgi:serine/threonine protein kinase
VRSLAGGRYEVVGLLGRGGMAEVHAGFDCVLHRPVAIKTLLPHLASRDDIQRRFAAEARAGARLSHPNAVAVYDTGEHEGAPYIVMERLTGTSLADRIAAGEVDRAWLLRAAGDVLQALGAAHRFGLLHRDVKPGNLLITGDNCAKIADFGIAKVAEDVAGPPGLDPSTTGELLGTPAYIAPERIEGHPASARSDLYSLGVVLYEALSGVKPFDGPGPFQVAHAIRDGHHRSLDDLCPDLSPHLVAAVERAMARDPGRRFASAQ